MKKVIRLTESDLTRIVKRVIKEDEEQRVQDQLERIPLAKEASENVEDALSPEEQDYLKNYIENNEKQFLEIVKDRVEIAKQKEESYGEYSEGQEDDEEEYEGEVEEPNYKDEFQKEVGMSREEFDIRKLIDKVIGYGGVISGLGVVPAAMAIGGGAAAALGITGIALYMLKDAAWYQRGQNTAQTPGSGIKRSGGMNYAAAKMARGED